MPFPKAFFNPLILTGNRFESWCSKAQFFSPVNVKPCYKIGGLGKILRNNMANETLKIKTPIFEIWQRADNIFIFRHPLGVEIMEADAKEMVKRAADLAASRSYCILVNQEGIKSIERPARSYFTKVRGPKAVALVGISPVARVIGNMFLGINKNTSIPFHIFSNEPDAIPWLKEFIE